MNLDAIDWRLVFTLMAAVIPSIILHEVSHGVVANAFGDDTAKRAGRITLNPIKHVDPFGTLILPALLAFSGLPAFGWAKPVPVNPRRLRRPRQQTLYVSLAGPLTNFVLAGLLAVVYRGWGANTDGWFGDVVFVAGLLNIVLGLFNLLPIPPLDGSAIIERFLPERWWPSYLRLRRYSFVLLVAFMFLLATRGSNLVFEPAWWLWLRLAT
ncbi:MAG: site-2 protease family protein [Acidimicrobiales bacterium]